MPALGQGAAEQQTQAGSWDTGGWMRGCPDRRGTHLNQTMQLSSSSTVVGARDLVSSDLPDEAVILDLHSAVYFGLNVTGARIWALLQQPTTVGAIRDAIVSEFAVEPERCERDLLALLQQMVGKGLVAVAEEHLAPCAVV